jgi:hypothetical protein
MKKTITIELQEQDYRELKSSFDGFDKTIEDIALEQLLEYKKEVDKERLELHNKNNYRNEKIKRIANGKVNLTIKEAMDCVRPDTLRRNRIWIEVGDKLKPDRELEKVLKDGVSIDIGGIQFSEPLWACITNNGEKHSIKPASIQTTKKRVMAYIENHNLYKSSVWELMK